MFQIFYGTYLKISRNISLITRVLPSVLLESLKVNLSQYIARKQAKIGHFKRLTD